MLRSRPFLREVPDPEEPQAPRSWTSSALARGTYAVLVLSSHAGLKGDGLPPLCGWVPALEVGAGTTRVHVALQPGIVVPLRDPDGTPRGIRAARVLGPGGVSLPCYEARVQRDRDSPPSPQGGGIELVGARLLDFKDPRDAECLLGPYPFASVTIWREPTEGAAETIVRDGAAPASR
jgi:hypothetical protein